MTEEPDRPSRARTLVLGALLLAAGALAVAEWRMPRGAPAPPEVALRDSARLEVVTPAGSRRFTLAELRAALPVDTIDVRGDVSYEGRQRRYVGFRLERVLALAGLRPGADEVLYFQAADGFRATMEEPAEAPDVRGVIAFDDLDGRAGWEPLPPQGKSPAPFYLVWAATDTTRPADQDPAFRRPWPYQLVRIEAINPRTRYDRIYPEGVARDHPVYRGYRAFVIQTRGGDQCIACHSLNGQGGNVGPELNVPRNITEYRDEATLRAFIRDPRSFRAGSPMPAFDLNDDDLGDILAYLRWLRDRKVQLPA